MSVDVTICPIRFGRAKDEMPSLGALCLAAALDAAGYSWRIDTPSGETASNPFSPSTISEMLVRADSSVIALSLFHDAIPSVIAALDQSTHLLQGKRIFLGGPGVVGIAGELIDRLPMVEAVVVGEGETALVQLLHQPATALKLPGIYSRSKNTGKGYGRGRTPREDLTKHNTLPWQAFQCAAYQSIPLSTVRGCPFGCNFCEVTEFLGRRITMKDLDRSLDELEKALGYFQVRHVSILDDTFTLNRKRVFSFCEKLIKRRMGVAFTAYSRTDTIDLPMMECLAEAGCERLFFGLDAGDDELLREIRKGISVSEAASTVVQASEYFDVAASFIWGYPFETLKSFTHTLDLARTFSESGRNFSITPQIHLLSPSVGTSLYQQYGDSLILDTEADLLPLCDSVRSYEHSEGFDSVMTILSTEPRLSTAFYRYASPDFESKLAALRDFEDSTLVALGTKAISLIENADPDTSTTPIKL